MAPIVYAFTGSCRGMVTVHGPWHSRVLRTEGRDRAFPRSRCVCLPGESEAGFFQGAHRRAVGNPWKLRHLDDDLADRHRGRRVDRRVGFDLHVGPLPNGLGDVGERLRFGVALRVTPWERGTRDGNPSSL